MSGVLGKGKPMNRWRWLVILAAVAVVVIGLLLYYSQEYWVVEPPLVPDPENQAPAPEVLPEEVPEPAAASEPASAPLSTALAVTA